MNREPMPDRIKMLFISYINIMEILCGKLKITNIPDNTTLLLCNYNYRRQGFEIIIENPSFPLKPIGQEADMIIAEFEKIT